LAGSDRETAHLYRFRVKEAAAVESTGAKKGGGVLPVRVAEMLRG
jgi:hypothetical protein